MVRTSSDTIKALSLTRSLLLKKRAGELIPGHTQTFSKGPSQFVQGVSPVFLQRGQGSHVWDADGNEYIDYISSLGPIILGHDYPAVSDAAIAQIHEGTLFSLPHQIEVEVAELLVDMIPCAEMVRFGKNGSDVTAGAVRIARAFTDRDIIACAGYHGWQDWYVGTTTRDRGVPKAVAELTTTFAYNDLDSLRSVFARYPGQVAAVILEPFTSTLPHDGFLEGVQEIARREGALLVFDEVITGFRFALGGAQEYFGVTPDMACFGKALANGYPLSAVVGRREVMELFSEAFFSFTFGGEAVSLAAAKATLGVMRSEPVISHLWNQGQKLQEGYNALAESFGLAEYTRCVGLSPRTLISFTDGEGQDSLLLKSLFQQEVVKRGVLSLGGHNVCYSHSGADIEHTLRAYEEALRVMAMAIDSGDIERYIEGEPVQPVFRKI